MANSDQQEISLSELVYTIAKDAPLSLKRFLPERYFRAIQNEAGARKFATESSFEEKREFFSYMGIKHFVVFANVDKVTGKNFKEILLKFKNEKPASAIQEMAERKIYVSSDKTFVYLMGMMAQSLTESPYSLNMQLQRVGLAIKKWKKESLSKEKISIEEKRKSTMMFCKLMGAIMRQFRLCQSTLGISECEMLVLLYLYENVSSYVSHEDIVENIFPSVSKNKVSYYERKLLSSVLIERHFNINRSEFTITARGILMVNEFVDRVLKSLDF